MLRDFLVDVALESSARGPVELGRVYSEDAKAFIISWYELGDPNGEY